MGDVVRRNMIGLISSLLQVPDVSKRNNTPFNFSLLA